MEKITNEFEINWWVEDDGVLYLGPDGTRGQMVATTSGQNNIALSRYTVTRSEKTTNAVQLRGPLDVEQAYVPGLAYSGSGLRPIAEAKAPDIDGSLLIAEADKNVGDIEELETAALRSLYAAIMDDMSGSMEINGLASSNTEALSTIDIGDFIFVDDSVRVDCPKDVITGIFMVTDIQHRANTQRGWEISVDVSRVPDPDQIEVTSVFYDPEIDKEYESLEAYRENEQEIRQDEFPFEDFLI